MRCHLMLSGTFVLVPRVLVRAFCLGVLSGTLLSGLVWAPWAWSGQSPAPRSSPDNDGPLPVLTLDQGIRLALARNPDLSRKRALVAREKARTIRAGELSDPKLVLGEQYVPITLNLGQSLLAMTTVGLRQGFSPWGKRALLREGSARDGTAARWTLSDARLRLVRDLRITWIALYRDTRTELLLKAAGRLRLEAFKAALARYRQGFGSESDLLFAKLQKDTLVDAREALRTQKKKTLHRLMRLMHRSRPFGISREEPPFPIPLPESLLLARLNDHPAVKSRAEQDAAQALRVQAARKDSIPAVSVEGDYSYFMGPSVITATPNLFSVLLTMNLPVRPGERQDQEVREKQEILESLEAQRDAVRQKLSEEIRNAEAAYRTLSRRSLFLDRRLLPEAHRTAEAALEDYATGTIRLDRVLETMKNVEEIERQALDIRTDRLKEMAELDYLSGTLKGGSREP